jgi:hypothetical protein
MINEVILTTYNNENRVHMAPMGIHIVDNTQVIIMPFKPSTTLDNLLATRTAVINYCDDVRVFAGCLAGQSDFPVKALENFKGFVLECALAHGELELLRIEEDAVRPKLFCKVVETVNHASFNGFNRAQFSVIELAILVSRLTMLPLEKIESDIAYLHTGFEKTAGAREYEAWDRLMAVIKLHKKELKS